MNSTGMNTAASESVIDQHNRVSKVEPHEFLNFWTGQTFSLDVHEERSRERGIRAVTDGVFVWRDADYARFPIGLVRQSNLSAAGILNHVKISDDVSSGIPYDAGTRALGNLIQIESKEVPLHSDRGDIDDGRAGGAVDTDVDLFIWSEDYRRLGAGGN